MKGAARGNWNDVRSNFDQHRKAKANDTGEEEDGSEPDMFGEGGAGAQAAE